jgi:hypothetical protein
MIASALGLVRGKAQEPGASACSPDIDFRWQASARARRVERARARRPHENVHALADPIVLVLTRERRCGPQIALGIAKRNRRSRA